MRRLPAALAAAATAGLGAASTTTAQADTDDTPGYSLHHITVQTKVGPDVDQSCLVDADLYVPDGVSAGHKAAAILSTNGFGGSKDDSNESAVGRGFARAGYVVLTYTGLGFPSSGCKITLDDPDYDGKAGRQMVDVLAGARDYTENGVAKRLHIVSQESPGDPRVGMIGGSYGGQIQYAVAEQDKRVDALIPIITWDDLAYSLAPNNTGFAHGVTYRTSGVAKKEWIDLFFGEGVAALQTLGYPDDATLKLARHASVESYGRRVTTPALARPVDLVGSSRLTLHLTAPLAARSQATGPAGKLVLFAKLYDVAPDGTQTLHNRLISPVRVAHVTKPVDAELPAVVQRFPAGHRIRLVVAASDVAYAGNAVVQPVTIRTSPAAPGTLRMPLYGDLAFR